MAQLMCDICNARPATVRVAVLQDGKQRDLNVCDFHYAQLTRHQRMLSPLDRCFVAACWMIFWNPDRATGRVCSHGGHIRTEP
jgi:hypothetical protein